MLEKNFVGAEVRSSVEYVATAEEIGMTVILFGKLTKIYIPKKTKIYGYRWWFLFLTLRHFGKRKIKDAIFGNSNNEMDFKFGSFS